MKKANVIRIDLAKNVIQVCVVGKDQKLVSNKAISPDKLKELPAKTIALIVSMKGSNACR